MTGDWRPATALSPRHAAQGAVERREIAEAGERERQEETVVGRDRECAGEILLLVLEREPAALRVVVAADRKLVEISEIEIAAEVEGRADVVVLRVQVVRRCQRDRNVLLRVLRAIVKPRATMSAIQSSRHSFCDRCSITTTRGHSDCGASRK